MEKIFEVWVPEARQKIFETDEIIAIKKTSAKKYSAKQLRAKRRKTEAKAKNKRRVMGTSTGNPYRGKAGDFYRQERLFNNFGMDHVMKHESDKIKAENREFLGRIEREEHGEEEVFVPEIEQMTAVKCFEEGDYEMLYLCLRNNYSEEKVIAALESLDEEVS